MLLPHGFATRPPTMDDLDAVIELTNLRSQHDIGEDATTFERMRMWWREPGRDLETDNLVVTGPDNRIVGYADFSEYEPYDISELDYVVHPDFHDIGIDEYLFDWGERRAREALPKAPSAARVLLETQIAAQNLTNLQRLKERGYEPVRVWNRMRIEMNAWPVEAPSLEGIIVRALQLGEEDRVYEAWMDAQCDEWGWTSLTSEEFRYYFIENEPDFDPGLWLLAVDSVSGEIAGYAICRWERPGVPDEGQVRYLGVRRPYRRRGLGQTLLQHAFSEFYRRGKHRVGLSVDSTSLTGAERLYERAGMHVVQQTIVLQKVMREENAEFQVPRSE